MSSWVLYILQCADGSLYTGITNDLEKRITAHNLGQGAKYTRGRGPFIIAYLEDCSCRSTASRRELQVKNLTRADKLHLIQQYKNLR